MEIIGILLALGLLGYFAFRGWSVLVLAPIAALIACLFAREPLLAHLTQTFMPSAGRFVIQYLLIFLLGSLFAKLMDDSGSVAAIATFLTRKLGPRRMMLAIVLAAAVVTYGGVSLFVAAFVLAPMARTMFQAAAIPSRLMPAAIALGSRSFTMTALPGTPAVQNAIPMPFFGTTLFAAPGLGIVATAVMFGFGMWWLWRAERAAQRAGEGYEGPTEATDKVAIDSLTVRETSTTAQEFDPAEIEHGQHASTLPSVTIAVLPLATVFIVNVLMAFVILPNITLEFLSEPRWAGLKLSSVQGLWSVVTALALGIFVLIVLNWRRLPALRETLDAGANGSVLPLLSVAALSGLGAVVAALPAFQSLSAWLLALGGPVITLVAAIFVTSAVTASASGGLTIAMDAFAGPVAQKAAPMGIEPALLHRVASISSGCLDSLPHNGSVVTILSVCGKSHRESYRDVAVVLMVGPILALIVVLVLGVTIGTF